MSDVGEEFASSLSELTVNSKPHINMLTMLAEDNLAEAPVITQTVLAHLQKVPPDIKLPVLYLIDSIVKNVGKDYIDLFTKAIVQHFTTTFEKVDEKTREQMFKLRTTWIDLFPPKTIYALDAKVHEIDPAWPLSAPPSTVHLNPKFFKDSAASSPTTISNIEPGKPQIENLREQMIIKKKMLLDLEQKKLKLELEHAKAKLEEQQKQLEQKQSTTHKIAKLAKLPKVGSQDETNMKDLKKQVAKNFPKLQEIHRVTLDMKAQKVAELGRVPAPESLVKPSALLELETKPVRSSTIKSVAVPVHAKLKPPERHKQIVAADSTEEAGPPVRIAPVSSQLINAVLSSARIQRDPRIRQMSSRIESQLNTMAVPAPLMPPPPIPHHATLHSTQIPPTVSKKLSPPQDPRTRHKKDKKSSKEHERSPKKAEEEYRHSKNSSRKSDRSPNKHKTEKTSISKRSEKDKKSKLEDLFSTPRSDSPEKSTTTSNTQSPSKANSKRDQSKLTEFDPKNKIDKKSKVESSPKRAKLSDSHEAISLVNNDSCLTKTQQKLPTDALNESESSKFKSSSEYFDSSAELSYDEDIENIVKHPKIISKSSVHIEKSEESPQEEDSSKFSDDSMDDKFDDIIKNPTKYMKTEKPVEINEEKAKQLASIFDMPAEEDESISKYECPEKLPTDKYSQLSDIIVSKESIKTYEPTTPSEVIVPEKPITMDYTPEMDFVLTNEPKHKNIIKENVDIPIENEVSSTSALDINHEKNNLGSNIREPSHEKDNSLSAMDSSVEIMSDNNPPLQQVQLSTHILPENHVFNNLESSSSRLSPHPALEPPQIDKPLANEVEVSKSEFCIDEDLKNSDKSQDYSIREEKKPRKGEKPSIMEQLIADAESHDASPSPPPPPVISDKFKEIKQSSLSRLRKHGRPREDLDGPESPEPTDCDVDLRPPITAPLIQEQKNDIIGLAEKDVDLRSLPTSPSKKRVSMDLLDAPASKKSKAEVMDELFGSEDVDLRPVLCPPPPSPPPPPRISSPPSADSGGEKLWARYKQTRPDTYKSSKYTPSRRDRAPSVDRFGRSQRYPSSEGGRTRTFSEDIDMRAIPAGANQDGSYNHIIMQAFEQHKRGDLNAQEYKKVLSEVFSMREKHQLEEARRWEEEEAAQTDPISDDDVSGGSLSGVENAPSPTDSYSGGEEKETSEKEKSDGDKGDVDARRFPKSMKDLRQRLRERRTDDNSEDKTNRSLRALSPYSKKVMEKEKYRSHKEELKAHRREKSRRAEERKQGEDGKPRFRKSRFNQEEPWESREEGMPAGPVSEGMEVDAPRVPPLPHFAPGPGGPQPLHMPQDPGLLPAPPGPGWNNMPRIPGPGPQPPGPWPGPPGRGPAGMGLRPQERFMHPRWRPPGPGHLGEPRFNRFGPSGPGRFQRPMPLIEIPPSDPAVLKMIDEDPTKSISIDGVMRDIRFYGPTAVAFMSWDDPREVSFQPSYQPSRRIIIDDRESIVLPLNSPPIEVLIDGKPHRMRFGAPTRELYIDNQWYEVFFGGPPVACKIGNKTHMVKLEGPPPQVRPGIPRRDLVVGKITLIIDAVLFFTIFLDAKPQRFDVDGVSYIIRFVEALKKTVINGVAFESEFEGLPRRILLNGKKHFFRLSALPRGVIPGYLNILNMEGGRLPSPPPSLAGPPLPPLLPTPMDFNNDNKPPDMFLQPPISIATTLPPRLSPELGNREDPQTAHPPAIPVSISSAPAVTTQPPLQPPPAKTLQPIPPPVNPLDMLMPMVEPSRSVDYSYSVDNENSNPAAPVISSTAPLSTPGVGSGSGAGTGDINVTELLQKLMATGIMPSLAPTRPKETTTVDKPPVVESPVIKPVDFCKPDTLKTRQSALIAHMYSGIQCNSCGVRFPPEQTMKYSQHLDWHFRQNRRDRDSSRTAQSRRYYYDVNDWVQFEEIEDLEERAQPWFEMQEGGEEEPPPPPVLSVCAAAYPEDAACDICHDKFESFYNEEKDEWHLRNAQDHEGTLVHPLCLEDQKAAAEKPIILDDIDITEDDNEVTQVNEDDKPEEEQKAEEEEVQEITKAELDDDILEVKDLEVIVPVFPVEDLTVSDSEDVADEEKPKSKDSVEEESDEQNKPEGTTEEPMETSADSTESNKDNDENKEAEGMEVRDESSQDDLIVLEKGENSILSTEEILEVVRNIKKDPDALGGEFEDIGEEGKKEKGAVPVPEPVVDTTHTNVTSLMDGNVEFEETPQQITAGGPPKIKINIAKAIVKQPSTKEKDKDDELDEVSSPEEMPEEEKLPSKLAFLNQPLPPGEEPVPKNVKQRLLERKLTDTGVTQKGHELSGLCSIM